MLEMRGWSGCIDSANVDVQGSWSEAESPSMLGVVEHAETNQVGHKSVGDDVWACRVTGNGWGSMDRGVRSIKRLMK